MLAINRNGNQVYIVDAQLIADGQKTMRVKFKGKLYFWQKSHAELAPEYGSDKFAIRVSFYNIMYAQDKTKRVIRGKIELLRNPIRRISKN